MALNEIYVMAKSIRNNNLLISQRRSRGVAETAPLFGDYEVPERIKKSGRGMAAKMGVVGT